MSAAPEPAAEAGQVAGPVGSATPEMDLGSGRAGARVLADRPGAGVFADRPEAAPGPGRAAEQASAGHGSAGAVAGPAAEVLRARAYLSRVAEPPAPALARLVTAVGPVEAAARVLAGAVPEGVARETSARRTVDRVDEDLGLASACGGALLTPEHSAWPHWVFAALEIAAHGTAHDDSGRGGAVGGSGVGFPSVSGGGEDVVGADVLGGAGAGAARDAYWPHRGRAGADVRPARGDLAPPIALWVRGSGELDELCNQAAAIVGARAATGYGLHIAGELGAGLASAAFTVVSGAAIGVDGAAHRGALAAGGATIAVLACGVDRSYPAAHEALLDRIAGAGVVVSEYPPGSVPARHRFLVRNRLIAGLAAGTVVVEAGLRSGAQRTAADARALGRPVMAVPGPVTSGRSAGCHRMIRDGAVLVTRVEEVLEEVGRIGQYLAEEPAGGGPRPTDGLSALAALVHDALPARAAHGVAWLAAEAGVPPNAVRAALDELVGRELVEHVGGRWQRPQAAQTR
jgi:DNA processing protein